jgi:hypothetical protein
LKKAYSEKKAVPTLIGDFGEVRPLIPINVKRPRMRKRGTEYFRDDNDVRCSSIVLNIRFVRLIKKKLSTKNNKRYPQ